MNNNNTVEQNLITASDAGPIDISKIPDPLLDAATNPLIDKDPKPKDSKFVTKGEKIHKWGTYLGVDWLLNAVTGVSFAYLTKYTHAGKKYWSGPITEIFTQALKPFIKNEKQLTESAGYGNMFMSVIAGGMFTIPPLMVLENNKVKKSIVQTLDGHIYGRNTRENDSKVKKAHQDIEDAPIKDFTSGLTSRFAALAPLLAMVIIPTSKKISNKLWFDHVEHASELVAKKAGLSVEKSFKNLELPQAKERWKFIHESVAMDFGLGIPYAILHEFFYNKFAARKDKLEPALPSTQKTSLAPAMMLPESAPKQFVSDHFKQSPGSFVDRLNSNTEAFASQTLH